MKESRLGKRFIFACIAVVCVSIVTVLLKYEGPIYTDLIKWVCGIFVVGQTVTDYKKNGGKNVA